MIRRWGRRLGGVVLVVLTLLVGEAIIRIEPTTNDLVAPFPISGRPAQAVRVGDILVTTLGVRGAARIKEPKGLVVDTAGVWVIIKVRLVALSKTTSVGYFAVGDHNGRTYRESQRWEQSLREGDPPLQPGIPVEGEVAFEVPRDAASQLSFQAAEHFDPITGLALQAVTDIPVPVPANLVELWAASQIPLDIPDAQVVR